MWRYWYFSSGGYLTGGSGVTGGGADSGGIDNEAVKNAYNKTLEALLKRDTCKIELQNLSMGGEYSDPAGILKQIYGRNNIKLGTRSEAPIGAGSKAKISLDKDLFNHNSLALSMGMSYLTNDLETAQAVEILHELSHPTGKFSHPGFSKVKGTKVIGPQGLNQKIYQACFG